MQPTSHVHSNLHAFVSETLSACTGLSARGVLPGCSAASIAADAQNASSSDLLPRAAKRPSPFASRTPTSPMHHLRWFRRETGGEEAQLNLGRAASLLNSRQ